MPTENGFMKEPTSLHIQVKDGRGRYDLSLHIDFESTDKLEKTINEILPIVMANGGTITPLLNHFTSIHINGVKIQRKDKVEERNEHYHQTGN